MKTLVVAATVLLLAASSATAANVHFTVSPAKVAPGGAITVRTTSSPCLSVDTVSAISKAFPGDAFGGEGALTAQVDHSGAFTVRGHVRTGLHAGTYTVGFRCGGGNLGSTATLHVR